MIPGPNYFERSVTLNELIRDLDRRRAEAERMNATAPVADVLRSVLQDLQDMNRKPTTAQESHGDRLLKAEEAVRGLRKKATA